MAYEMNEWDMMEDALSELGLETEHNLRAVENTILQNGHPTLNPHKFEMSEAEFSKFSLIVERKVRSLHKQLDDDWNSTPPDVQMRILNEERICREAYLTSKSKRNFDKEVMVILICLIVISITVSLLS